MVQDGPGDIKSDEELARDFQAGRREAFEVLMKRHMGAIYNLGARMCRRREDADDLVQNTFLNALRYLNTFRGEARFRNWLFRIAVTRCLRMKREIAGLQGEKPLDERDLQRNLHGTHAPSWTRKPDQVLLDSELRRAINESIAELSPESRLVFVLRDQEGFTTAETAEIVNLSPGAVKTRLHRARAFLAGRINGYFEEKDHGRK